MPLSPGQALNNRYRIVKLLGQGGFGAVYRAWDLTFEIACAIKENSQTTPEAQRQFLREARLLRTLRHPNLPQVTDFFVVADPSGGAGSAYLVMDYVEGEDLEQLLARRKGPLGEAEVLPWIGQVCDALSYLHAQNPPVIHRDVKPANIKITPEGRAVLVDFGISKVYDATAQTTVGARAVTPGFSPLEQYGLGGRTDARSDVYALGATLYALLTGQAPPEATDRSPSRPLSAPRKLNPKISPPIEAALIRALGMYPEERFPSAAAFKAALGVSAAPAPPEAAVVMPAASPPPATAPLAPGGTVIAPTPLAAGPRSGDPPSNAAGDRRYYWIAGAAVLALLLLFSIPFLLNSLGGQESEAQASTEVAATTLDLAQRRTLEAGTATSAAATDTALALAQRRTAEAGTATSAAATEAARPPEGMALIPAGAFMMGSQSGAADEKPVHEVYLEDYYIDRYEVTKAQFAEFLNARGNQTEGGRSWLAIGEDWSHIRESGGQWQAEGDFRDHPVIGVTWYGARAYCEWRGARLPTEAEWEKAARGGLEGAKYPWGDESPTCELGTPYGAQYGACGGLTVPVGSFAPNGYGLFDMAGNVWEWVSSEYQDYPYDPGDGREDPEAGSTRVLRGGSWYFDEGSLRVAIRGSEDPVSDDGLGFRCAHSVEPAPAGPAASTSESPAPVASPGTPTDIATAAIGADATLPALAATETAVPTPASPEGMAWIPAGEFRMGGEGGEADEKPVHEIYLGEFFIDIYEVTNARFAEFLNAEGNQNEAGAAWLYTGDEDARIHKQKGAWQPDAGYAEHPVIDVTWYGARAYCEWRGARLPTEAEWEKAARGGLEGKKYPWGSESPDCEPGEPSGAQHGACSGPTVPVGSFGPNGYGLFDMAGSVWEWVSSLYQPYPYDPGGGREDPQASGGRVVRGGSWSDGAYFLRVAIRYWYDPTVANGLLGFRCARSP